MALQLLNNRWIEWTDPIQMRLMSARKKDRKKYLTMLEQYLGITLIEDFMYEEKG